MEVKTLYRSILLLLVYLTLLILASCGPIIISSRPSNPPPPWFYPNRVEMVRYVYFPEFSFYYDLSAQTYLYLDAGAWVRRSSPPTRYRDVDLRRVKYERVRDYNDDNIRRYHEEHNINRSRSYRSNTRSTRNNE